MTTRPWVLWDPTPLRGISLRNHGTELGEISDYYLVQTYHFTDEISLLIPISHMALRLVSLGLNHKDWLVLCVCVCFSLEIFTKLTVSVTTTNNLLLSLCL